MDAGEWAAKYVKAALENGLIPKRSDYTTPAIREILVEREILTRVELGGADELPRANGVEVPILLYNQFGGEMDPRPSNLAVRGPPGVFCARGHFGFPLNGRHFCERTGLAPPLIFRFF